MAALHKVLAVISQRLHSCAIAAIGESSSNSSDAVVRLAANLIGRKS